MEFKFADAALIREFFKDIQTGRDGESYDVARVVGLWGSVAYFVMGALVAWHSPDHFLFVDFGGGFAALAGGAGGWIALKAKTEPDAALPPAKP